MPRLELMENIQLFFVIKGLLWRAVRDTFRIFERDNFILNIHTHFLLLFLFFFTIIIIITITITIIVILEEGRSIPCHFSHIPCPRAGLITGHIAA